MLVVDHRRCNKRELDESMEAASEKTPTEDAQKNLRILHTSSASRGSRGIRNSHAIGIGFWAILGSISLQLSSQFLVVPSVLFKGGGQAMFVGFCLADRITVFGLKEWLSRCAQVVKPDEQHRFAFEFFDKVRITQDAFG